MLSFIVVRIRFLLLPYNVCIKIQFLIRFTECLVQVFKKSGVEKYDPTNEQFDPNRHNAAFRVPDASKPPGTIAIILKVMSFLPLCYQ